MSGASPQCLGAEALGAVSDQALWLVVALEFLWIFLMRLTASVGSWFNWC